MVLTRKTELERMTSAEISKAVEESNGIALIPVGAIEVHGPYLPLNVDTLYTVEVARRAAKEVGVVVAPTVPWGNSQQLINFPGTITLKSQTLIDLVKDIGHSLVRHGFDKTVILNGHGGNISVLDIAGEDLKWETGAFVCNIAVFDLASVPKPPGAPEIDSHAGSQEASVTMVLAPDDIDMEEAGAGSLCVDVPPKVVPMPRVAGLKGPISIFVDLMEITKTGHFGDPAFASKDRGEEVLGAWTNVLVEFLRQLKEDRIQLGRL